MLKKSIYILESCYSPTAASTNRLFAISKQFAEKGVVVHFFYLFPDETFSKSTRYLDSFQFHYLWEGHEKLGKWLNAIISLIKFVCCLRPDIPVYVYSNLNALPFIRLNKSIKLFHEYTENPEVIGHIHNKLGDIFFKLYKITIPKIDGLFVITPALKELYVRDYSVNSKKVEVINVVVDPYRFDGLENTGKDNLISYCGILSDYKDGINILIKSFVKVHERYPDYRLLLMGKFADKKTENSVLSFIDEHKLDNSVLITGIVPPEDMPRKLKSSKILALARPNNEQAKYGFATKIGEYLMSEVPVVMTNVGNVTDYLTDCKDVILAEPDNAENFAEKLMWVIENYREAEKIGKEGKKTALKFFNPEYEAEKILKRIFDM